MAYKHFLLAALLPLAACGGGDGTNPINGGQAGDGGNGDGGNGDVVENTVPDSLALNLNGIAYNPGDPDDTTDDTLSLQMTTFDNNPLLAEYQRNPALDVPGYVAFSVQDDPLDRIFVAVAGANADGTVQAVAVADGGQFGKFYRGTYYTREGDVDLPTTGLVSYAGTYAGVTNLDDLDQDQRLPIPPGTNPSLIPSQPRQTTGTMFLNVDFDDNGVNGAIYDRQFTDGETLDPIVEDDDGNLVEIVDGGTIYLDLAPIDENGEFIGTAYFITPDGQQDAGTYGGIFGGVEASAVGGTLALDTIYISDDVRDGDYDAEVGAFVLPRCGTAEADDAICDEVKDFGD